MALVLMARMPLPGKVKTRLMPLLTSDEVCELYRAMLLDTVEKCLVLEEFDLWVAFTPDNERGWFEKNIDSSIGLMAQRGEALGDRMHNIIEDRYVGGAEAVLVMGTDLPTLPMEHIRRAGHFLRNGTEVVLGPSEDGGYYLIGLCEPEPRLFEGIEWGSELVLEQTLYQLEAVGKLVGKIPSWFDVDEPQDVNRLRMDLTAGDLLSESPRTVDFFHRVGRRLD